MEKQSQHILRKVDLKFVVGLSGGVDSLFLLRGLVDLYGPDRFIAAHYNHGLRAAEADADEQFCRDLCQDMKVELVCDGSDVAAYAAHHRLGTEDAGRQLRHAFFSRVRDRFKADWLVLGHHADDRVETILFNFLRGAGPRGVAGMPSVDHQRRILRPLSDMRKSDILRLAQERGWTWREDSTNAESVYDRNWLRNEILPALEDRRSGVVSVLLRSASQFGDLADYVEQQCAEWLAHQEVERLGFCLLDFKKQHVALQKAIVVELWSSYYGSRFGIGHGVIHEVLRWLSRGRNGSQLPFGGDFKMVNRNGRISIEGNAPNKYAA